jgi:hypothetical protein
MRGVRGLGGRWPAGARVCRVAGIEYTMSVIEVRFMTGRGGIKATTKGCREWIVVLHT